MGEYLGLRTTIAITGVGGLLLGFALVRYAPLRTMHELPEPADAPLPPVKPTAVKEITAE
jgi:hypothetical protein